MIKIKKFVVIMMILTGISCLAACNFKDLKDIFSDQSEKKTTESSSQDWKEAYIDFIDKNGKIYDDLLDKYVESYKLVNINNDNIPELYINFGSVAGGDMICSYYDGSVIYQNISNFGLAYLEGGNLFVDSGGRMDAYHDVVYSIGNGTFNVIGMGEYGAKDNSEVRYDEDGYPDYDYYWNGEQVADEGTYEELLKTVFDRTQEMHPYDGAEFDSQAGRYVGNGICDYYEIIQEIKMY